MSALTISLNRSRGQTRRCEKIASRSVLAMLCALAMLGATDNARSALNFGPYNAVFLAGGIGLTRPLAGDSSVANAGAQWSMSGWIRVDRLTDAESVVAVIGDADKCRGIVLLHKAIALRINGNAILRSEVPLEVGAWHSVAATYDGRAAHLFWDGVEQETRAVASEAVAPSLQLAPTSASDPAGVSHFGGALALFSLADHALTAEQVQHDHLSIQPSDFALIAFHNVGVGWPLQEHAWRGLQEPQPAWTLPHAAAALSKPEMSTRLQPTSSVQPVRTDAWTLGDWHLSPAAAIRERPELVSSATYRENHWYPAIVPGTVLTTLIANGIYPDPDFGLNNLAIPESLNREDYWYRTSFESPATAAGRRFMITLKGINYAAEIWFNGTQLGALRGAFIRGTFDVTSLLQRGGANVLAVRISPPPHPGIPHEQSVAAGPGENGGSLAIDGPTFIASEGWDWIPAIRDRNSGLWQSVELSAIGSVRILDPQVTTRLPLPRTDVADVVIRVPVENAAATAVRAVIEASFGAIQLRAERLLAPGVSDVIFDPSEFKALRLVHPRLWWPNGYGSAELYTLELAAHVDDTISDTKTLRFGVRQISYELSLFDHTGALRRVEVDPTLGTQRHERLVDTRHAAIKRTATGWAQSLTETGESSPAARAITSTALTPYLVIRVNGVRIAARGGSWGMDDSRKRIGRERLEPFFRLHRQAHLNIIRNWVGQNTEEVFYDLADEYGLLVFNDFWESTQDFQLEPDDPQLFLANAADVVRRYRNHPSIALWVGRNEGVPQPVLNEGLADLIAGEDGTRLYTGSSNRVNLQDSGPYNWRPPAGYFTDLAQGFAVEVGTPSLASLESLQQWIPQADRWPLGDTYAYHDWHFGGNGDTASFMQVLERGLGAATDLADFERKAQLMNYDSYRAIFEGFQAGLWLKNSGRMLWMTHPSWPSNAWQIYTSDYDTAAAFYAVAKACEPIHAQMNLPDFRPAVVNIGREPQSALRLSSRIFSVKGELLFRREDRLQVAINSVATLASLPVQTLLDTNGTVFIALTLTDRYGLIVSHNVYWQGIETARSNRLAELPQQPLMMFTRGHSETDETVLEIELANRGPYPALMAKLTILDDGGARVLPAFYTDNYLTLLPGEQQHITVRYPGGPRDHANVSLRGWNVASQAWPVRIDNQGAGSARVRQ